MQSDQPKLSPETPARRPNRGILVAVIAVVIVVLVLGGFAWMIQAGATATVRDVFIILMAIVSLFIGLLLLALVYQIAALTRMLREEIKPLLENAQETINTARGATTFVSDNVVRPVIGIAGTVAGVARVISMLSDLRRPRR
ncbi:MAG: hypothetical protein ACRDGG_07585 [Anaerolineae bacterium]